MFGVELEIQVEFVSEFAGRVDEALLQPMRNAGFVVVDSANEIETLDVFQGVLLGKILDFPEFPAVHGAQLRHEVDVHTTTYAMGDQVAFNEALLWLGETSLPLVIACVPYGDRHPAGNDDSG